MFIIHGNKFEAILSDWQIGIFDKRKAYFIVFTKFIAHKKYIAKHAIYLWRGEE